MSSLLLLIKTQFIFRLISNIKYKIPTLNYNTTIFLCNQIFSANVCYVIKGSGVLHGFHLLICTKYCITFSFLYKKREQSIFKQIFHGVLTC